MPSLRLPAATLALVLALGLAACGSAASPVVSFDPSAPCPAEGQQPGSYPELEALLPSEVEGVAPAKVDSGRLCSADSLGTLAEAGIDEVRYAGATWPASGASGYTLAVFTADGLDAPTMLDFYATPAEAARRTEELVTSETTVGGVPAHRLDVLGSDGTGQTVVTWQPADDGPVWVLLAADVGDTRVAEVLQVLGTR